MNMASQSQQSMSQHWFNIPPEILGLILSYLGKHDLLKARMVSHAWNDESLKVLRKSKFTQVLRDWNMKEYIHYATPSGLRKCIIPFHLNFKIKLAVDLQPLTLYVGSLCKIFGPQCVSALTLTTKDVYDEENILEIGLCEFITLISAGLKTFDFTRFNFRINLLNNGNRIISFPYLKTLICNTSLCKTGESGPEVAYISIIENSPKLKDLTLTHHCDLESWPLKFNQLKYLSLYAMLKPQNILDKILASSGPPVVLRELSLALEESMSIEDKIVVYNILMCLTHTLKSLNFRVPMHLKNSGNPRPMTFPILPHLEHFGLEYNNGHACWLYPQDNFSPKTFPSLKSIELPIGFIFSHICAIRIRRIEFPNLSKLILRVDYYMGLFDLNYLKGALEHLQEIFPTPSKLSLVNVGGDASVKHLLDLIIKSNWSNNIQDLEMIGFHQNYLGEFLDEMEFRPRVVLNNSDGIRANESNSIQMTNLTTIKLDLMDEFISINLNNTICLLPSIIPNLSCLGEHFPKLRMIEISGLWCHRKDMDKWRRHILEFKSKFPGIVLNVP